MPKKFLISDKSKLFDGCPTAKLRKKYVSSHNEQIGQG